VQTLSDLRSDHRALVLFDRRGCRLRTTLLEAPIAFVGASIAQDTIFAIRHTGGPELVTYAVRVGPAEASDLGCDR